MISAMNTHLEDHRVLSVCCFALAGFSGGNSSRCERIVRDGGVEVLIKAMNRYREHVLLQVCVCMRVYACVCMREHVLLQVCVCMCVFMYMREDCAGWWC